MPFFTFRCAFAAGILAAAFLGAVEVHAQDQGQIVVYPPVIRLDKGKTASVTAIAYTASGEYIPNQNFQFRLRSGPGHTATIRNAPVGNTQKGSSRFSRNLGEITANSVGTVTFFITGGLLKPAAVTVSVVDPSDFPQAIINGDSSNGQTLAVRVAQVIELNGESSSGTASVEWSWGDGDSTHGLLSAAHAFLYPGTYPIHLKVTNSGGMASDAIVNVVVGRLPEPTRTFTVTTSAQLMAAYDQCTGGEEIEIPGGTIIAGQVRLKARQFSDVVTIRSSAPVPEMGSRVLPSSLEYAVIQGSYSSEIPFVIDSGASMIRLSGLKFEPFAGTNDTIRNYYMLQIGDPDEQNTRADNPRGILIDHCLIDPPDNIQVVHGILNNGYKVAIISSWLGNIRTYGAQDSQAIFGLDGQGAHVYNNDYLEAASESVIYGGARNRIDGLVPTNIEFRRCVFTKQLGWRELPPNSIGDTLNEKNLFETKNARRVYVEGSIFSTQWDARRSQFFAIALKSTAGPPNSGQGNPWSVSEDIVFENNRLSHANGAVGIGTEFEAPGVQYDSLKPHNIKFSNMLFDDITFGRWGGERGWAFFIGGVDDLSVDHVTIVDAIDTIDEAHEMLMYLATISSYRLSIRNSILPLNYYGVLNTCGEGIRALDVASSGWLDASTNDSCGANPPTVRSWDISGNVFPKMRSEHNGVNYPNNNFYPNDYGNLRMRAYHQCSMSTAMDLCSAPADAFELWADSPYKRGYQGDPGVDIPLLNERIKCTVSGDTSPCLFIAGVS